MYDVRVKFGLLKEKDGDKPLEEIVKA